MRLAVYTTAYPAAERFLPEWYASVAEQTDPEFDLWIGVDGSTKQDICRAIGSEPPAKWIIGRESDSPSTIRARAMQQIVSAYDGVVFVDSDDVLCRSRVEAARRSLQDCDLVACPLHIIDEDSRDLGRVFGPIGASDSRDLVDQLPRYNVFGLSNTAYRCQVLGQCLPIPGECVLLDWLLATRAWSLGAKLCYDPVPRMKYRQYRDNTARVLGPFTGAHVLEATGRVLHHYECLLNSRWKLSPRTLACVEAAQSRASEFNDRVTTSPQTLSEYIGALNQLPPRYVWWWIVAHPNLEDIWKH